MGLCWTAGCRLCQKARELQLGGLGGGVLGGGGGCFCAGALAMDPG